jgi:hypothetical protein
MTPHPRQVNECCHERGIRVVSRLRPNFLGIVRFYSSPIFYILTL